MERKLSHGLQKRFTYNELVNYIERDPDKIKYPNRTAGRAWDSIFRMDFSNADAVMAARIDEHAQATTPGNVPYVPPSDRPAGPGPPPENPSASPPDAPAPPPWWRHLPTPIPLDPRYFINRVNGNGGPDSFVQLDDLAEPLLPNDYLGPPPGPGGGGIPHPGHQAAQAQDAALEAQANAFGEAASQSQVTHSVQTHEAPIDPVDAFFAEMTGTPPPSGGNPLSNALNLAEQSRAAATLAGMAAFAGGVSSLAGSMGKSAASAAPVLASAAAAAGSAVLHAAGSTFHAADQTIDGLASLGAEAANNLHESPPGAANLMAAGMLGAASLVPQAAYESMILGSAVGGALVLASGAAHHLTGFTNAMQQAMPSIQHHATHHVAHHVAPPASDHRPRRPASLRVPLMLPSSSGSSSSSSSARPPTPQGAAYWYNASDEEIEAELVRRRVPRQEWVGHPRSYKIDTLMNYIEYDAKGAYRRYQK